MLQNSEFLAPVLTGKRFEDHAIPLELFEDFSALQDLVIEVAKWIYFQENQDRKRVPRGFYNDISLKLSGVGEGSAIAKILLVVTSTLSNHNPNIIYFEKAKENIIKAVDAAETDKDITEHIPMDLLWRFNQIGKGLKDDESIDFSPNTLYKAHLNKISRKKLVLASSSTDEILYETLIITTVPEVDKERQTFTIINDGQRIITKIPKENKKVILEAFSSFESKFKIRIEGVGKFNRFDKLLSIELIKHISAIDPLDINVRLDELSLLKDGWYDGVGVALNKDNIKSLADFFETYYDTTLPLPYLYPTIDGGIQAEWIQGTYDISLNIDLNTKNSVYHSFDSSNDETLEIKFNLSQEASWRSLNEQLIKTLKT